MPNVDIVIGDLRFLNGHLVCNRAKCDNNINDNPVYWCNDLGRILVNGQDRIIWWEGASRSRRFNDEPVPVEVPTFPSLNVWTKLLLCPTENFDRYLVRWKPRNHPENQEGDFLTFFSPGESITSVREVLFQQMYADPEWTKRECNSPSHGFRSQVIWEADTQEVTSLRHWAQRWMVFHTGWCLECTKNKYTPDDDLVPGAERNVWNPHA